MKKTRKIIYTLMLLSSTALGLAINLNKKQECQSVSALTEIYSASTQEQIQSAFDSSIGWTHWVGASLIQDVVVTSPLYVDPDAKAYIDLHGHVLSVEYPESIEFSIFNVDGGLIINDDYSQYTPHQGAFASLPEGGVITGGIADKGGAVYVSETGNLTIEGGTIYGNKANVGGGIYSKTGVSLDKNVGIYGNSTKTDSTDNNLYLTNNSKVLIYNHDYYYNKGMNIGISMENPGEFLSENGKPEYRNYFHSDDSKYKVAISKDNKLKLQIPETANVEAENGNVSCNPEKFVEGDEVTFTYKADDGYVFDSVKVNGGDVELTRTNDNTYKFIAGESTNITVKFIEDYVKRISWKNKPSETIKQGEEIDLTDVSIKVTMASRKTSIVNVTKDMISGFDPNKIGEQTITVTYGGVSTTFIIKVTANRSGCNSGVVIGIAVGVLILAVLIPLLATRKKKDKNKK